MRTLSLVLLLVALAWLPVPAAADATVDGVVVLLSVPQKPYEVIETYVWEGKPTELADVLPSMIAKMKKLGMADALLVRETDRTAGEQVTRVLARAIHYTAYEGATNCRNCHDRIYEQHAASMHSRSASNPVFLAQYFQHLLPRLPREPQLADEAARCIACHDPIEYQTHGRPKMTRQKVATSQVEVTCDFCHTIRGLAGSVPGNGNYLSTPAERKKGPFKGQSFHYEYSRFVRVSEFCGMCHNATNRFGVVVKATYDEWLSSTYGAANVHCQECHMNREGYLLDGMSPYDWGVVSHMVVTRRKLYDHRFPGAYSLKQTAGSLGLAVAAGKGHWIPGQSAAVTVTVDNGRAGHSIPTGSADLRLLWLDVRAFLGGEDVPVELVSKGPDATFGTAGAAGGRQTFTSDVPKGSRVYRAIFVDASGEPTLAPYDARSIIYDNRLRAAESRDETYRIMLPAAAKGPLIIKASLKYLRYPSAFARSLDLPALEPHEIAAATAQVEVLPAP